MTTVSPAAPPPRYQGRAPLEAEGEGYRLRTGPDRRRRPLMTLTEAQFLLLVAEPGLKPRPQGGWIAAASIARAAPPPGRPGVVLGERVVVEPDGVRATRVANLGESPIAWLARRRDASGQPWLGHQQEELRLCESHQRSAAAIRPGAQAIARAFRFEIGARP